MNHTKNKIDRVNARVLAAAPELLAALKLARIALEQEGHHAGVSGTLITIDAALTKADYAEVV